MECFVFPLKYFLFTFVISMFGFANGNVSFTDEFFSGGDEVVLLLQCVIGKIWLQTFVLCLLTCG